MPKLSQRFKWGGLNTRDNNLNRDQAEARDLINVCVDSRGDLSRVNGDVDTGYTKNSGGNTLQGMYTWNNRLSDGYTVDGVTPFGNEVIVRESDDTFYGYNPTSNTKRSISLMNDILTYPNQVPQFSNFVEVNNCVFTDGFKYKYDGLILDFTGVPADTNPTISPNGANCYVRTVLAKLDMQGNWVFGSFFDSIQKATNFSVTMNNAGIEGLNGGDINGFEVDGTQPITTFTASFTINVTNPYVVAGQWILCPSSNAVDPTEITRFKVISSTATTVTLDSTYYRSVDGVWVKYQTGIVGFTFVNDTVCGQMFRVVYTGATPTGDFYLRGISCIYNLGPAKSFTYVASTAIAAPGWAQVFTPIFADFYDEEVEKTQLAYVLDPDVATSFGDKPFTGAAIYNGTSVVTTTSDIYFSDNSLGGTVENFNPFDTFTVGDSNFGDITGVFATEDFIMVSREKECYYITGNIITGNFSVQPFNSTQVGLTSQGSIARFKGGGYFMSNRGIQYCSKGGNLEELTDKLENIFVDNYLSLGLDLTKSKTVIDFKRERIYTTLIGSSATNDRVLVFDYYRSQYYMYKISARGGIQLWNDKLIYSDENKILIEDATSNLINGVAIDNYYITQWQDISEPGLRKKFIKCRVYSSDNGFATNVCRIRTYENYDASTVKTDQTETYTSVFATRRLNTNYCYTMSFSFSLGDASQNSSINGYEFDYEVSQMVMKDE